MPKKPNNRAGTPSEGSDVVKKANAPAQAAAEDDGDEGQTLVRLDRRDVDMLVDVAKMLGNRNTAATVFAAHFRKSLKATYLELLRAKLTEAERDE